MRFSRGCPLFTLGLATGYVLCLLQLLTSPWLSDYTTPHSPLSNKLPATSSDVAVACQQQAHPANKGFIPNPKCNCFNVSVTNRYCGYCSLSLISAHKMGFTLNQAMAAKVFSMRLTATEVNKHERIGYAFRKFFENPLYDYRHVVVTRNLYSSLISGYLYHKDGKECWLDWYGRNTSKLKMWLDNNYQENWEARINSSITRQIRSWPAGRGRDLCRYLSQESEEDGMRIYMEWAITMFYQPLHEFWIRRREKETTMKQQKTIHICYEDEERDFRGSVQRIADWMGIGTKNYTFEKLLEGNSGHQTHKDANMFSRLREIIFRLDGELFNNSIAVWDHEFNCSS